MMTIDVLVSQTRSLSLADVELWVRNEWVKPETVEGVVSFGDIDIARVLLIRDLHYDLDVDEAALPIVLSLIDQVYDLRRHLRLLSEVMQDSVPDDLRSKLLEILVARRG